MYKLCAKHRVLFLWEGKVLTCIGSSGTGNKLYAKHLHVVSVKEMNSKVHQSKSGFSSLILFIQTKLKQIWQLENTDKWNIVGHSHSDAHSHSKWKIIKRRSQLKLWPQSWTCHITTSLFEGARVHWRTFLLSHVVTDKMYQSNLSSSLLLIPHVSFHSN